MNPIVLWMLVNVLLVLGVSGVGADEESVFVKEGDSVTLYTNIEANQQEKVRWYFKDTLIAKITGDQREICSEDECKERFRDRLKLDHQTASLTIMNTRTTDSGDYTLKIINTGRDSDKIFSVSVHGVSAAQRDEMKRKSVKEGESVTLDPGVVKNPNDVMKWYFNDIPIAEITGDQSKICTDDECKERFRDRLKLDHQTGSLTIINITNTDSGEYKLQIIIRSSSFSISRILTVLTVIGVSGVDTDEESVFVKEGDSVTLRTNIEANQQETMRWYFNDIQITKIIGEKREICSYDECKERFRDRLKLDHQTGSLIIMNTRTTDSGLYKLKIINTGRDSDKIFSVSVHGVSAAEQYEMKRKSVKEGESVTLEPGVVKNPNDVMTWYFNDFLIAEITGDQSKICTDDECKERFRDRLKLDHQTGSLTIMNTRTTDSGDYKLQITNSSRFSISRILTVLTVNAVPDSGLSPVAGAGIGVLLLIITAAAAAAAVFLYRKNPQNNRDQGKKLQVLSPDQSMTPCIPPEVNAS
uniref:Immunoglobulin domain-containing protein n=1 Tax=Cyprinus carpio carpio TaxID=630221 RepID=A0A8C1ENU6_CYPCA